MLNHTRLFLSALSATCLIVCGHAEAQLKEPSKSQSKGSLGSGLGGKPTAKPAAKPAAAPAETKPQTPDEVVQEIANCVLAGLPQGWQVARVEVIEIGRDDRKREFEAKYSYSGKDGKNAAFTPCDPREPAQAVYKLNGVLEADKRNWIRATLFLSNEGKFELQYDYPKKEGEADVTPAAKPDPNYDPTKK